ARLLGPTEGEKVVYFNTGAAWRQYDSALDRILQFANVSWPAIVEQAGLGFVTEAAELLGVYRLIFGKEALGQESHVLLAFTQGRNADRVGVEPVVQIGAETSFQYELLK